MTDIQRFHIDIPAEEITELQNRLNATRWPNPETPDDWSRRNQYGITVFTFKPNLRSENVTCPGPYRSQRLHRAHRTATGFSESDGKLTALVGATGREACADVENTGLSHDIQLLIDALMIPPDNTWNPSTH